MARVWRGCHGRSREGPGGRRADLCCSDMAEDWSLSRRGRGMSWLCGGPWSRGEAAEDQCSCDVHKCLAGTLADHRTSGEET